MPIGSIQSNIDVQKTLLSTERESVSSISLSQKFPEIWGSSKSLKEALRVVEKVSNSDSSVLILGESGTGKELVAAAIHRLSDRNVHRFVAINCSAIPEELLEAELFGHEKGAFTGADRRRVGHFGAADQGTIFLDEIGDMPARLQAKLLRVLQEKSYSPIGSHKTQKINVRVIAATNKDLEKQVKEKSFRLDLFYRINVLPITLPALKKREGDIDLLLYKFCEVLSRTHRLKEACWFSDEAISFLRNYSWPGNIRELQNLVERMVVTKGGGDVKIEDLPDSFQKNHGRDYDFENEPTCKFKNESEGRYTRFGAVANLPNEGINLSQALESMENNLILEALQRTNNNKNQASKLLGMNRTTLVEKIKKRNLSI